MKPATSPFITIAISAAIALTAFATSSLAQSTITEKTVVDKTVTTEAPPTKQVVTTEIEFQPASTAKDINVQMLRDFANVKQGDSSVATEIARNPAVVENPSYVAKHPGLQAFLAKYPNARDEIVSNTGNFVTPVAGSKWNSHEAAGIPRN